MFSQASVILFTGGCIPACTGADTPRQTPPGQTPPSGSHFSGWYTSYCNAFLLLPTNEVWGKVIFLHLSVILFTGGICLSTCWDAPSPGPGRHPPRTIQTPPQDQTDTPPGPGRHPHQCRACWEIRSTRGWYASYWNAFLFHLYFQAAMADSSYSEQASFDTSKYTLQFFERDVQLSIFVYPRLNSAHFTRCKRDPL